MRGSEDLDAISQLEDVRTQRLGELLAYAVNEDPRARARVVRALARLQDPASANLIIRFLGDPDAEVRAEAAFAAGILGLSWTPLDPRVQTLLAVEVARRLDREQEPQVVRELLAAVGRVGTLEGLSVLQKRAAAGDASAMLALGVAVRRGARPSPEMIRTAGALSVPPHPVDLRYAATYFLAFSKEPGVRSHLAAALADADADVRALAARGLGEVGGAEDAVALARVSDDPDPVPAVEAVRALLKLSMTCKDGSCGFLDALGPLGDRTAAPGALATPVAQLVLTVAQGPHPPSARPLLVALRERLPGPDPGAEPSLRFTAGMLDCRLAAAVDRLDGSLGEVRRCGHGAVEDRARHSLGLRELAASQAVDAGTALAEGRSALASSEPAVRVAGVALLGKAGREAIPLVRPLLRDGDPVVAATAATTLASLDDRDSVPAMLQLLEQAGPSVDVIPPVIEALARLKAGDAEGPIHRHLSSREAAIRHAAAAALSQLTGAPVYAPAAPTGRVPPGPTFLAQATMTLVTDKGLIEIAMEVSEAPRTVTQLTELARTGFFTGLAFHRVVPGFVAQGGDPRGDGEGGPGYTMRCEVNRLPYRRGTVGMALSGKDTGGSQFFIAVAPQPHLDGRYTVFGQVRAGMEVVDRLVEGDVIRRVLVTEQPR